VEKLCSDPLWPSITSQRQCQPGNLGPMMMEGFNVGPGVVQDAIARAQEIAALHIGLVRQLHDVIERNAQGLFGLRHQLPFR